MEEGKKKYSEEILRGISKVKKEYANRDKARKQKQQAQGVKLGDELSKYTNDKDLLNSFGRGPEKELDNSVYDGLKSFSEKNFQSFTQNKTNFDKQKYSRKLSPAESVYMNKPYGLSGNELRNYEEDFYKYPFETNEEKILANNVYAGFHNGNAISNLPLFEKLVTDGTINDYNISLFTNNKSFTKDQKKKWQDLYIQARKTLRTIKGREIDQQIKSVKDNPNIPKVNKNAIIHELNNAKEQLDAADGGNVIYDWLKGVGNHLSDSDFWTVGITEFARNKKIQNASEEFNTNYNKYIKQGLSEEEASARAYQDLPDKFKAMFDAYATAIDVNQLTSNEISNAYKAGQTTADILPLAVTMGAGSGANALIRSFFKGLKAAKTGSKIAGTIGKGLEIASKDGKIVKSFEKSQKAVQEAAKLSKMPIGKQIFKDYGKTLARGVEDAVTTTLISPKTYADLSLEKANANFSHDDFVVKDYIKSFGQSFIDNVTETSTGAFFSPATRYFNHLLKIKPNSALSKIFGGNNKMNKYFHFGGALEEISEEYAGAGLNVLLGYGLDDEDLKNSFKEFLSKDSQTVLFASILPATMIMGVVPNTLKDIHDSKRAKAYRNIKATLNNTLSQLGIDNGNITQAIEIAIASGQLENVTGRQKLFEAIDTVMQFVPQEKRQEVEGLLTNYFTAASKLNEDFKGFSKEFNSWDEAKKTDYINDLVETAQRQSENTIMYQQVRNGHYVTLNDENGQKQNYIVQVSSKDGNLGFVTNISHKTEEDKDGNVIDGEKIYEIVDEMGRTHQMTQEQILEANKGGENEGNLEKIFSFNNINEIYDYLYNQSEGNDQLRSEIQMRQLLNDFVRDNGYEKTLNAGTLKDGREVYFADADANSQTAVALVQNDNGQYEKQQINLSDIQEAKTTNVEDVINNANNIFTAVQKSVMPNITAIHNADMVQQVVEPTLTGQQGQQPTTATQTQGNEAQETVVGRSMTKDEANNSTNNSTNAAFEVGQTYSIGEIGNLQEGDKIELHNAEKYNSDMQGHELNIEQVNKGNIVVSYSPDESDPDVPRRTTKLIKNNRFLQGATFTYKGVEVRQQEQQQEQTTQEAITQQPTEQQTETHQAQGQTKVPLSDRIKSGEIMNNTPEQTLQELSEELDNDEEDVANVISSKIEELKNKISKTNKPKTSDIAKIKASKQKINHLQQQLDYWQKVQQQANKPTEQQSADETHPPQTTEEQKQSLNTLKTKFDSKKVKIGNKASKILPNGKKIKGTYILVEAGGVTASHNPNKGFSQSEDFPRREDGTTINDRDYQNDKAAQAQVRERANKYDGRAVQDVPIVDENGVVLSGNDRTMSGELAARQNTDGAYIEFLKENAAQFGFNEEDVASARHPRVVFVTDEQMPYTTETFAVFNQNERKSQNDTQKAIKISKVIKEKTLQRIAQIIDKHDTIAEVWSNKENVSDILKALVDDGLLTTNEVEQYVREDGLLSDTGKSFIETVLLGSVLKEETILKIGNEASLKAKIVSALAQLIKNRSLSQDYSLIDEINEAVLTIYDARKTIGIKYGDSLKAYYTQLGLFVDSNINSKTIMMLADILNANKIKELKNVLNSYNEMAQSSANGELDMFSQAVQSKEEILENILNQLGYGERNKQIDAISNSKESSRDNGTEPRNEQQGSDRRSQETTVARGEIKNTFLDDVKTFDKEQADSIVKKENTEEYLGNIVSAAKKEKKSPTDNVNEKKKNPSGNILVTDEMYEDLKKRMRAKLRGQFNVGIDPEILEIGIKMAVYHIERSSRKFIAYSKAMINDLGDEIRPYLKSFYNAVRDLPEMAEKSKEMDSYDEVSKFDVHNFDKEKKPDIINQAKQRVAEKKAVEEVKQAKKKLQERSENEQDLFSFSNGSTEKSVTLRDNNKKDIDNGIQGLSRDTTEKGTGRHVSNENGALGTSQSDAVEQTIKVGMDKSSIQSRSNDELGSRRVSEPSDKQKHDVKRNQRNFHNEPSEKKPLTVKGRLIANLEAVKLMKDILSQGREASAEEKKKLSLFTGWGGLGVYFSENNSEYQTIRDLLTDEEFDAAVSSLNTAFYTPENIINSLWQIAEKFGFKGGKILEGSAGVGNIISQIPTSINEKSDIEAVEIDSVTGNILKLLYPDAKVNINGFEKTYVRPASIDLAITNVPFVTGLKVWDENNTDISKKFGDIHNFCIAKNVRSLREGGLGIFITSKGTLDNNTALIDWITSTNGGNADFVGAFRLNNKTFGGTNVTSDIIVIKKRSNGEISPNAINVSSISKERDVQLHINGEEKTLPLMYNTYFVEHPENMGGKMYFNGEKGETFRPTSMSLFKDDTNQDEQMKSWLDNLNKHQEEVISKPDNEEYKDYEKTDAQEGVLIIDRKGNICQSYQGRAIPIGVKNNDKINNKGNAEECLKDYQVIKQELQKVLDIQTNSSENNDNALKSAQKKLNDAYDNFVDKYGYISIGNRKIKFLKNDVDFPSIMALEDVEEIKTIDKTGKTKTEYKVKKEPIFSQRVIRPNKEKKPENISDAVILSINEKGFIDTERIAQQLNLTLEQTEQKIIEKGLGFVNPTSGKIEVSYEYLSGNVREKLDIAKSNNTDGRYDKNIQALEKVLPTWIPAHLINVQIGASWVPVNLFYEYVKDRYDFNRMSFHFRYVNGVWITNTDKYGHSSKDREGGVYSEQIGKQIYASDIFLALLNNQTITVQKTETYYENGAKHTMTVTDKTATEQCVAKAEEMKEDFGEWVGKKLLEDEKLKSEIETTYNNKFNNLAPKEISDEFLPAHFEGASLGIELYKHQKKAVMRALTEPLLLAHEVGTGKTFTMITTAMEMKRLKMSNKPMIVVQNATLEQFVSQAKKLYPAAKILSPSNNDKTKDGRQYFYSKVKYGQWDIIVVPQSMFNAIPDGEYERNLFMIDKINEKEQAILSLKQMKEENKGNFNDERIISQLEKDVFKLKEELTNKNKGITASELKKQAERKANAQAKAEKQLDRKTDENLSTLKDMGVDALFVDEAHEYKRLGFETTIKKVRGIDQSSSKRATALFLKTKEILRRKGGKNVVFATGTPISNTAAEIWTFMKYLLPKEVMQESGIYYFDDFVRNFGKIAQVLEFSTNGKYRENTRFLGYNGLPELIRMWATISDTVLSDENAELNEKIPETELGGKTAQDIFLDQTQGLAQIMRAVRQKLEEYEKMNGKDKKNNSHIPLVMFGIAKRAAIDPRLVDENAADEPNSKTNQAVKEILRSLNETKSYKGTVAVFCDRFNRKATDTAPAFNLFEDIKQKLIKNGVNADEIFVMKSGMTDTAKSKVFDKVNSGDIRVIMGSTQLLGVGVNIQERLHTLIHMDAPDRPMDYEQRNGRILRQGNLHKAMNKRVRILRFGVKKSLDVSAYQRLKTKQAFIHSIMDGKERLLNNLINREEDEINEEGIFDNPVAMLSGSQYALELNQAKRTYTKYKNKEKEYNQNQLYATKHIPENEKHIENNQKIKEKNEKRLEEIGKYFPNKSYNSIEIAGKKCTNIQQVEKVVKDKINKRITEKTEDIRKDYTKNTANLKYNIKIDDVPVELDVVLTKEMIVERGVMKNVIHKSIQMTSKDLNIENIPTFSQSVSGAIDFIINNIVTGDKIRKDLSEVNANITRYEKENKSLKDTLNKPFEFGEQLQKSKDNVERLTDLMNKEIAENEKEEERLLKESGEENVSLDKLIDSSFENEEDESGSTVQAEIKLNTNEEQGSNITGEERNNANEQEQALMNELEGILTNAGIEVISDNEEAQRILDRANGKVKESREEFNTDPDFREYQLEESGKQYKKAQEVVEALKKAGMPDFYISRSMTYHGVSTYIIGYGAKFRISDHSVTSPIRIRTEEFFKYDTPVDKIVEKAKQYKEESDGTAEKRREKRRQIAKEKWERIKDKFNGYVFKRSENISSDFEKYTNRGYRFLVRQTPHYAHSFDYEWVEKAKYDENGNIIKDYNTVETPSVDFILELDEGKLDNIEGNIKFFKTSAGEVYGFTYNGKIYLDKSIATAETLIHEYTHLWAAALRKKEPKHWEKIVNLMKGTEQWEQVKETYKDLQTDDEIADEVLAHYSGKRGAERLREERKQATQRAKDDNAKVKAVISVTKIRAALKMFWQKVTDFFGGKFSSAEKVADMTLADLMKGVNPNKKLDGKENIRLQMIGERGAAKLDRIEEATTRLDNLEVASKENEKILFEINRAEVLTEAQAGWLINKIRTTIEDKKATEDEVFYALRELGLVNASANKGYGWLSDEEREYNDLVYYNKDALLLKAIDLYQEKGWNVGGDENIVYFRHSDGRQISFHIIDYDLYKKIEDLPVVEWDKVVKAYMYDNIEDYNKAKERSKNDENQQDYSSEYVNLQDNIRTRENKEFYDNGEFKKFDENGRLIEHVEYKDGKGLRKCWHENGQLYLKENYINDKKEGLSEMWYENGKPMIQENYKNGKKDGVCKYWQSGHLHADTYKNNILDGISESWFENGNLYSRMYFKNGKRDGTKEMWNIYGQQLLKENYKNNRLEGISEYWNDKGQLIERSEYKNDLLDGTSEKYDKQWKTFYRSNYKNGKKEGLSEDWRVADSNYQSPFDFEGRLRERSNYKNGKLDGLSEMWYENGTLRLRANYKNSYKDGLYEEFYENGQLYIRANYINRELEGIYEEFDENGTLRLRANYKNGYKDGLYERWNEKGKRTVKSYYNEDKKVTAEKKDNHYYIGDKIDEKSTEQRRERNEVLSKEAEKTQETAEKTINVAHESIIEKMFDKSGIEYEMLSSEELLDKAEEFDSNIKQVLATNGGVVYGFTVGGKIYLDRELAGARTKIHEYTHLWDKFCQKNNPDMWKQGVELMKQTQLWEYIKNSGLYDDLSEYDLASEIHARLVGKEGDNFLREMQQKAMEYGDNATVWKRLNVISKLKDWLRGFWKWVKGEQLGEKRAKEMNIDDFVNMPIMDLMNGTDIRYEVQSNDHYSVLQAEIEAEEEYGEELNRRFENLSRAERKHAKAGTITNAGDIAKGEQDGNQILPKRKKGITSKGTIVTNSVFQKAVLRYGGGWQWDEQKKKFVKKKNLLRGVDNFFDRFAPVRRMVTMCKLLGIDVINNPYYALVDADNVAKGLADVRIQPRVIQHYTAIQDIMKATGLTYDEVNNLLTIRSIPERTAKLIAREFDRIEKRVLLLCGETLSKLDGMEAEQIIDDLVATGKTDINKGLSEKEGVFAKNFLLCMEDINENELEDFVSQVQEKIIGGKENSDEQEKWIRKSCARLMAARDYRDNYSYNTNTYEELDGIFKRYESEELQKQGISGQIQGYGAEHDMYLTPLYQKLFGKNDKRTLHTPQEIIEKTEEIINKNEQSKEAYKKLTANIKKTVEEMNDFAVDNGVISEKLYNSFQINNGTWLPLRGWDADIYKVFGEDTANQKINEIARGRSRFPDNPLKYLYAEYDTTIRKAAFNNAKRFFVEFIHKYPELFIESNMTASSVVYKWKPNTENQKRYAKLIEKSKSLLKEDERDEGFVITRFRPAESEINGKEDITQGILQNDDLERSQFLDEIKIFGEDYDAAYTKGNESLQKYIWTFRDGGVTRKIVLNDKILVEILNSPTLKPKFASSKGMNFIGKITRFLAMMMTSRNISFLLRNFARDFQEALFIEVPNVPQYRKNYAKYVWKDKGVLVDIIARPKDAQKKLEAFKEYKKTGILPEKYKGKEKEIDNWLDTYEEYNKWLEQGGATGYVYQFSNIGDHLKNYQKLAQQGDKNKVQKFLNDKFKNKQMKSVINAKTWDVIAKTAALKYIETLTEVEENLIRFASYRALKKGGLSDEEAAYQSREATVNFSRYGKGSKFFNTIFPFFGATMNAMYRDARLLAHNPLNFMKRMSMYFTVGLVNSLAAGLIGGAGDEDDSKYKYVSEFMKLRGFYSPIPITGLDNWFIPVPQSVYPVYGAGVLFGQILKGEKNMKEAAVDEINLFLGMLPESISSPISGLLVYDKATDRIGINAKWGDAIMRALTSGALNPIYDLYRNENYMGSNIIYNDSPFKHKTRIARSKGEDKNYWMFEKAAEGYNIGLNRALYFLQNLITLNWSNLFMGINNEELEKLFMDSNGQYNGTKFHTIAPEDLQHLFEGYVPSFSQLVFKGVDLITGRKDATKLMNYPIVNAISSKPQKENRFWETVNALDEITEKWKKDKENMKNYTDKQRQKVQSNIGYKIFEDWSSQRKSVMARRKQLSETIKAIEESKIYSEQQKRERTDKLYKQINSLNDNLIKKYNMVSLKENKWTTKDAINKITFGAVK